MPWKQTVYNQTTWHSNNNFWSFEFQHALYSDPHCIQPNHLTLKQLLIIWIPTCFVLRSSLYTTFLCLQKSIFVERSKKCWICEFLVLYWINSNSYDTFGFRTFVRYSDPYCIHMNWQWKCIRSFCNSI